MMPEEDYLLITGDAFTDMRLMIEGAITLYEDDTGNIMRHLSGADLREVRSAVNAIGQALYHLRDYVRKLEAAHCREVEKA